MVHRMFMAGMLVVIVSPVLGGELTDVERDRYARIQSLQRRMAAKGLSLSPNLAAEKAGFDAKFSALTDAERDRWEKIKAHEARLAERGLKLSPSLENEKRGYEERDRATAGDTGDPSAPPVAGPGGAGGPGGSGGPGDPGSVEPARQFWVCYRSNPEMTDVFFAERHQAENFIKHLLAKGAGLGTAGNNFVRTPVERMNSGARPWRVGFRMSGTVRLGPFSTLERAERNRDILRSGGMPQVWIE